MGAELYLRRVYRPPLSEVKPLVPTFFVDAVDEGQVFISDERIYDFVVIQNMDVDVMFEKTVEENPNYTFYMARDNFHKQGFYIHWRRKGWSGQSTT